MFSVSESDIGTGSWYAKMTPKTDKRKEISCFEGLNVFGGLETSPLAGKSSMEAYK